ALHVARIAEVGCDEACPAAREGNLFDRLSAACGVAAMDDDLETVLRQLHGDCATDAGRRAGYERFRKEEAGIDPRIGHCSVPLGIQEIQARRRTHSAPSFRST